MSEILVFDPALCCSTGVCGPEVDGGLVRFSADLEWLRRQGVAVRRFNLAQDAAASGSWSAAAPPSRRTPMPEPASRRRNHSPRGDR
jgi:hypothetical protein